MITRMKKDMAPGSRRGLAVSVVAFRQVGGSNLPRDGVLRLSSQWSMTGYSKPLVCRKV